MQQTIVARSHCSIGEKVSPAFPQKMGNTTPRQRLVSQVGCIEEEKNAGNDRVPLSLLLHLQMARSRTLPAYDVAKSYLPRIRLRWHATRAVVWIRTRLARTSSELPSLWWFSGWIFSQIRTILISSFFLTTAGASTTPSS